MKKILILILAFLIAASAASAVRVLEFDNSGMSCTQDGVCKLNFFYQSGDGSIDLDDVEVLAEGNEIKGEWVDRDGDEISSLSPGKRANFISDYGEFYDDGVYDMELKYPDDDGKTKYINFQVSSPGFIFSCDAFAVEMMGCVNKGGTLTMEIHATGFGRTWKESFTGTNPEKGWLEFYLPGNRRRHEGILDTTEATITRDGDIYTVVYPLGFTVSTATIRGVPYGCDKTIDSSKTLSYKKCTTIKDEPAAQPQTTEPAPITAAATSDTGSEPAPEDSPAQDAQDEQTESGFNVLYLLIGLAIGAFVVYLATGYLKKKE